MFYKHKFCLKMKNFLDLMSKFQKDSDSSDGSDSMDSDKKEQYTDSITSLIENIYLYKENGNQLHLEFLNKYSFNEDYHKQINNHLNKILLDMYESKEYSKLSYLLDEFHRDDNFLDGSILCEMMLEAIRDDDYEMLLTLLMADYANVWNNLHVQKAWLFIVENIGINKLNIIKKMSESESRSIISDILF